MFFCNNDSKIIHDILYSLFLRIIFYYIYCFVFLTLFYSLNVPHIFTEWLFCFNP